MPAVSTLDYARKISISADSKHLKILSILHVVLGALTAVWLCGFLPVLIDSVTRFSGSHDSRLEELAFTAVGLFFLILTLALCMILSAKFMKRRLYRQFSFVIATISLLHIPLGTILGIFTLAVLTRPTVKALYEGPCN